MSSILRREGGWLQSKSYNKKQRASSRVAKEAHI